MGTVPALIIAAVAVALLTLEAIIHARTDDRGGAKPGRPSRWLIVGLAAVALGLALVFS
jgi:hypothetical protein